MYQSYQMDS